ncbi:MAG TPA: glycosyltransferase family 39 protein [Chthoniobacterales bacterium]|nr:glycosyltransferase family 39 protein [Chthoniobacterales bacterium]
MVAGARTFTLEDTFLEPQILNPPPTRHALLAFLLTLAAVLHIGTAAWGDLYDGVEGQLAGGAREMVESRQWLLPTNNGVSQLETPPLAYWAVALSYKIFGITATAARIPIALAMVASVALIFLIGERLAGYWRGFAAGLIHLCSGGAFLLGRMVSHDSFFALFIAGAIYCLICGYQRRKFRWGWFAGFWFCGSLACLTKGPAAIIYLGGICLLLAIFFREARLRFRLLFHWSYLLLFVVITAPWFVWTQNQFPGFLSSLLISANETALPRWQFLLLHFAWWFPAIFLILPGLLFAPRKILRSHEMTFADALPLCWLGIAFLPFLIGDRAAHSAVAALPAFALFAACAWERTSLPFRIAGIALVLLAGGAVAAMSCFAPRLFYSIIFGTIPGEESRYFCHMMPIALVALLVFSLPALFLAFKQREELALFLVLGSMVPIGFGLAEGVSRLAPLFSMADAARFLNPRLGQNGEVLYEGPLRRSNSLSFYLNKKFFLVNQAPGSFEQPAASQRYLDEHFVLEAWDRSDPIYFIIEQDRVAHWRKLIVNRVHIYRQVTTSGTRVVLSNEL